MANENNKDVDIVDLAADMYHAVVTNASVQSGVDHRELPYWHELADSDRTFMREQAETFVRAIAERSDDACHPHCTPLSHHDKCKHWVMVL